MSGLTRRRRAGGAALVMAGVLWHGGCLGGRLVASSRGTTHVESTPSGADVYVMGEHVGTTPIEIEDRRIFPTHYLASRAALYGRIVLEHPGCDRTTRAVDLGAANQGLFVELACEPPMASDTSLSPPPSN